MCKFTAFALEGDGVYCENCSNCFLGFREKEFRLGRRKEKTLGEVPLVVSEAL
jgi:hypothetical protein